MLSKSFKTRWFVRLFLLFTICVSMSLTGLLIALIRNTLSASVVWHLLVAILTLYALCLHLWIRHYGKE